MGFNSREYEFADITVFMGGRDITGLRGIKYGEEQEKEAIYGKGNKPLSIQKGNKKYEGEIALAQSELEALTVGGRSVLDIELTIIVSYGNPSKGDMVVSEKIYGVQFTKSEKGMSQGDKFKEITLPFIALSVEKLV